MINDRFERKYVIDLPTYLSIVKELKPFVTKDKYAGSFGKYKVMSVYYDTDDYQFFREKIDGEKIRQKLRIRTYQVLGGSISDKKFIEIKRRNNNIVHKDRLDKINVKNLKPKILISYVREPFVSKFGLKLRVTFDTCLKYRTGDLRLETKPTDKYFLPPDQIIMEIKYTTILPIWIINIIQNNNCQLRTYSKYCNGLINSFEKIENFI